MKRIIIAATLLASVLPTAHALDGQERAYRRSFPDWEAREARDAVFREQAAQRKAAQEAQRAAAEERSRAVLREYEAQRPAREQAEREKQREKQEAAERDRQARVNRAQAEAAERERQRQEYEARESARKQAAREAAQEQARLWAMPSTRLMAGYAAFAYVSWCHEVRDGYLYKYINDADLDRAKIAVKAIVEQTTKEEPAINTDEIWQDAMDVIARRITPRHANQNGQVEVCQDALQQLLQMSPTQVYSVAKP